MIGIIKFAALGALTLGAGTLGYVALHDAAIPGAISIANGLVAAGIGVIVGLAVAWLRGIPGRALPVLLRAWRIKIAAHCAWAAVGFASVAVLIYY